MLCWTALLSSDEPSGGLFEARLGEFPHMCTLYTRINGFNVFIGEE